MRAALAICGLVVATGCGDNTLLVGDPLQPSANLTIVAHQDDDLLFMQPDLADLVQSGAGVTNVYVTAGNGTEGYDYVLRRERGLMAAYGALVGLGIHDWSCGWIDIAGKHANHCRLEAGKISLVFLLYPDGGKEGEQPDSLLHLWEGTAHDVTTIGDNPSTYSQAELIDTVGAIITATQPHAIRTLEVSGAHGRDHADHEAVGALAVLAVAAAPMQARPAMLSYRGYSTEMEPANKNSELFERAKDTVARYDACVDGCDVECDRGACSTITEAHDTWAHRRYAVGFRHFHTAKLRLGDSCLQEGPDNTVALGDCAAAPLWRDVGGELVTVGDDVRLQRLPTGELITQPFENVMPRPEFTWFVDDEGHIWSGVPPFAQPGMDHKHLDCLVSSGGHARAALCGETKADAPAWTLETEIVVTPASDHPALGAGRTLRLADVNTDTYADFVFVRDKHLEFVLGQGTSRFDNAIAEPGDLDIAEDTLMVADVDGDGALDACGLGSDGVTCATAGTGFRPLRWSDAFQGGDTNHGSFTAIDTNGDGRADLCALASTGASCAFATFLAEPPVVLSTWPIGAGIAMFGDLDGDGVADWCTDSNHGPACGASSLAGVTTDGIPWSFAQHGDLDTPPLGADATLADIDGDGLADLCWLEATRVACSRSNGRGFGPTFTLAPITGDTAAFGDLDADGHIDVCTVAADQTLSCALAP